MSMIDRAVKSLGLRQRSYESMFAEGSPYHHVLVELALYCRAFDADQDDLTHDRLMMMHGRRQVYFLILNHLNLSPNEIEAFYTSIAARPAAARRLVVPQGED